MSIKKHSLVVTFLILLLSAGFIKNVNALEPPYVYIAPEYDVVTKDNAILNVKYHTSRGGNVDGAKLVIKENGVEVVNYSKDIKVSKDTEIIQFDVKKEAGISLKPETEYTYMIYVYRNDGSGDPTMLRNGHKFTTPVADMNYTSSIVKDDSAIIQGTMSSPNKEQFNQIGIMVYKQGEIVGTYVKTVNTEGYYLSFKLDLSETDIKLEPNTEYSYIMYVQLKNDTTIANTRAQFEGTIKTHKAPLIKIKKKKITKKNAKLWLNIKNPSEKKIGKVGITVKYKNKKVISYKVKISSKKKYAKQLNVKFDLKKKKPKLKLKSKRKYTYTMYAYVGGKKYTVSGKFKMK